MLRKIIISGLLAAMMTAANANVLASGNDSDKERRSATATEKKDWRAITKEAEAKGFVRTSGQNMKSEYNQAKKANKKFTTTTKVLIGVGIAAAVLAVVFVAAKKDLKDDILR